MGSITLFNYLRIFDGYFLLKIFENILPRTRDKYSHKKENFFLFNMNSNHKEVMVMVEIVLSVSEEKQKKNKKKFWVRLHLPTPPILVWVSSFQGLIYSKIFSIVYYRRLAEENVNWNVQKWVFNSEWKDINRKKNLYNKHELYCLTWSKSLTCHHGGLSDKKTSWSPFMNGVQLPHKYGATMRQGGCLLFTTKFPQIPGTYLINLRRMKGWVEPGASQWFLTRNPWIGSPVS